MHIPIKAELEIKEDSKSLRKFVEVVSKALGFVGKPLQTYLQGKSDASATVSAAKAEIQADDLRFFAKIRREHLELRRAENIRAVVRQAPALLDSNPSDEPVDDDWAADFFEQAQDVSDRAMQSLWARILAGEVNKPGSFSLRTLHSLKTMTKDEAQMFERLVRFSWTNSLGSPFIFESGVLHRMWETGEDPSMVRLVSTSALHHLKNIGLVAPSELLYPVSSLKDRPYNYFGRTFVFDLPQTPRVGASGLPLIENVLGETYFTQTGLQLSKIANQTAIAGYAEEEMKYESDQLKIGFHELIART